MKIFHESQEEALMARRGFCSGSTEREVHFSYLFFSLLLDQFKRDMNAAIDGKVTDFLLTHDLIIQDLLFQDDFQNTIYQQDQSLIYHLSSCSLFKVDCVKRISYFTVLIPLVPENGMRKMCELLSRVTPSTLNNRVLVIVGEEDCKHLQLGDLCRASAGRKTYKTECLTSLMFF